MKTLILSGLTSFKGHWQTYREVVGSAKVDLRVVSDGVSVFVVPDGGEPCIVAFVQGDERVSFAVDGSYELVFLPYAEDSHTSVVMPWRNEEVSPAWSEQPSMVQLDLKAQDELSPIMRQMMMHQRQNDLRLREALAQIKSLQGK